MTTREARGLPRRAGCDRPAAGAARRARHPAPGAPGDHSRRQHRLLLRRLAARACVRLFGGARSLHRGRADRGVRRGEADRAARQAGSRPLRGDLLRVGRTADRSRAHRASLAGGGGVQRGRHRRQDRRSLARGLPHRPQRPHVGAGRHGLAQIGEFSFIIAGLGLSLQATGEFLYPIAVAVSAVTTLTTPWLIRASDPVADFVDRKLPRPLQTFVSLYASWLEQIRSGPQRATAGIRIRQLVRLLLLDFALLTATAIGTAVALEPMASLAEARLGLGTEIARGAIVALALAVALPLCAGIARVAQRFGLTLAEAALPLALRGQVDTAAAPRRSLVVTLQLAIVLVIGLPFLAVTQPLLGSAYAPVFFALLLAALAVPFWRGAANLEGHVRAGAQAIVEAIVAQAHKGGDARSGGGRAGAPAADALRLIRELLPGLGEPTPVTLDERSPAIRPVAGRVEPAQHHGRDCSCHCAWRRRYPRSHGGGGAPSRRRDGACGDSGRNRRCARSAHTAPVAPGRRDRRSSSIA